jgi:hypothetical protein
MTIQEYIADAPAEKQDLLNQLHQLIISGDPAVTPLVKPLMGKAAILYEDHGYMKYGLADTKKYISLHCLPMYMDAALHAKITAMLPAAQVQKGCINFSGIDELPLEAAAAIIEDCARVDMVTVLKNRKKK